MIFHFVYETKIETPSGVSFYYGKHSTNDLNDSYVGSGKYIADVKKKILKLKRSGKTIDDYKFTRKILRTFDSESEALEYEQIVISNRINDNDCVNMAIGGLGGQKGISRSPKTIAKMKAAKSGKNHPLYGVSPSKETIQKMVASRAARKAVPWDSPHVKSNPHSMKAWTLCDKIYCIWKETELKYSKLKRECIRRGLDIDETVNLGGMIDWFKRGNNPHDFELPRLCD